MLRGGEPVLYLIEDLGTNLCRHDQPSQTILDSKSKRIIHSIRARQTSPTVLCSARRLGSSPGRTSVSASLELARKRVAQNTELVAAGAGNRFDLEQAQTNVNELSAQLAAARAFGARDQVRVAGPAIRQARCLGGVGSAAGAGAPPRHPDPDRREASHRIGPFVTLPRRRNRTQPAVGTRPILPDPRS